MATLSNVRRVVGFFRTISKKKILAHCWHLSVLDGPLFGPWWSTPCCISPGVAQEPHSRTAVSHDAGEGNVLRRCRICRPLFSVVPQLCGWFLFSSSDALLNCQPPMTSIIEGYVPPVCVNARHLKNQQIAKRAQEGQAFYLRHQKQSPLRHIRCIAAVLLLNASMSVGQHWLPGLATFDLIYTAS